MNKMTIAAIAVAAVLLVAGAYVVISMGNSNPDDGNDVPDDGSNTQSDAVDSKNKTLPVSFPVSITSDNRKMALSMTYPGKGESSYAYNWSAYYQFSLNATPASGYTGNVLIKMFAERNPEIGTDALQVKGSNGSVISWTYANKINSEPLQNVISGDVVSWKTNGSASVRPFDVMFKGTGNYTLVIQAFDLDTGKAISDPVRVSPMYVPIKGSLSFIAAIHGQFFTTSNGTYYRTLVNITNDWNIRYSVDVAYFSMNDSVEWVAANTSASSDRGQSLAPGQTTQFYVYFDISELEHSKDRPAFALRYNDPISGSIAITLPTPK
jgi:hypothetical protein